jgi:hypothetical protein
MLHKLRVPTSTQTAAHWCEDNKIVSLSDYRQICRHLEVNCLPTQSGREALSRAIIQARKKSGDNSEAVPAQNNVPPTNPPSQMSNSPYTPHTPVSNGVAAGGNDSNVAELIRQAITLLGISQQPSTDLSAEQIEQVMALIEQHAPKPSAREIVVRLPEGGVNSVGVAHEVFEMVLALVSVRRNVYLHGPAGTGKSHIAKQVADALGLPFAAMSFTAQSQESKLFGYVSPISGEYIPTEFHRIYSEGGVFCLDEADAANPNLLNGLNMAIAQGEAPFPCGMVAKHPDFICIASANTFGDGATEEYIGRNPLDKATKDRFQSLFVGYDEALEKARFSEAACTMVWGERKRLQGRKGWVLSMRALERVDCYFSLGWSADKVYKMAIESNLPQNCRK